MPGIHVFVHQTPFAHRFCVHHGVPANQLVLGPNGFAKSQNSRDLSEWPTSSTVAVLMETSQVPQGALSAITIMCRIRLYYEIGAVFLSEGERKAGVQEFKKFRVWVLLCGESSGALCFVSVCYETWIPVLYYLILRIICPS